MARAGVWCAGGRHGILVTIYDAKCHHVRCHMYGVVSCLISRSHAQGMVPPRGKQRLDQYELSVGEVAGRVCEDQLLWEVQERPALRSFETDLECAREGSAVLPGVGRFFGKYSDFANSEVQALPTLQNLHCWSKIVSNSLISSYPLDLLVILWMEGCKFLVASLNCSSAAHH